MSLHDLDARHFSRSVAKEMLEIKLPKKKLKACSRRQG